MIKVLPSLSLLLPFSSLLATFSLPECREEIPREWISLQHREGKGIGYGIGYSTLEAFLSHSFQSDWLTFADLRGHYFNDGEWAGNAGAGIRAPRELSSRIYGINVYYDVRQTNQTRFEQIGGGFELFSENWDFHLNGYFPVGPRRRRYGEETATFQEHSLFFWENIAFAMTGGDFEFGRKLYRGKYCDLHAMGGIYYFQGEYNQHTEGGFLKLSSRLTRYFSVDVEGSYDPLFRWIVQGALTFKIAYGPKVKMKHSRLNCPERLYVQENLVKQPSRFEIIVASNHQLRAIARDPATEDPLFFVFVDNINGSSDGSFEHPFPTLKEAETSSKPGDFIYVFAGDNTSKGMDQGIILKPHQHLLGSGIPHDFDTSFGLRTLAEQTSTLPLISMETADASTVVLSNHNTVSGLHIVGSGGAAGDGIFGNGITDATISHNHLSGAGQIDLRLPSFSGDLLFENNRSESPSGILIQTAGDWNGSISNNLFTNDPATGTSILLENATAGDALVFAYLDSNQIASCNVGISTTGWVTGTLATFVENNQISNPNFCGILVGGAGDSTVKHFVNSNQVSGTPSDSGILVSCTGNSSCTAEVENNTLTGANCKFQFTKSSGLFAKLRLHDNHSEAGYLLSNVLLVSSPLFVEAPTLSISGLSPPFLNNHGSVATSGAGEISFVGFNP
jgi:hypothetical protein